MQCSGFENGPAHVRRARPRAGVILLAVLALAAGPSGPARAEIRYYRASADSLSAPVGRLSISDQARHHANRESKADGLGQAQARENPPAPVKRVSLPGHMIRAAQVFVPNADSLRRRRLAKVHPRLRDYLQAHPDSATVRAIITFQDNFNFASVRSKYKGAGLRDAIVAQRKADYDSLATTLGTYFGVRVLRRYWAIRAILAQVPRTMIDSLALRPDIRRIEPAAGGGPPGRPACGSHDSGVDSARNALGSAAYESLYGKGRIALLDTGVMKKHVLLAKSGRLGDRFDCGDTCVKNSAQTDVHPEGHGTSSAALLIGGSDNDPNRRGLTRATLDSYKVYQPDDSLSFPGAIHAFQQVLIEHYPVVVASIAVTGGGDVGALSEEARTVFDFGSVVVVANGNDGEVVTSPAGGSRVLGVGAYCIHSGDFKSNYVCDTTADGRYKPDLIAPTSIYTAATFSTESDDSIHAMHNFSGTSGAVPIAGATALLLRNRMQAGLDEEVPPGEVYAMMLLTADDSKNDAREGAGRIRLPEAGTLYFGEVDLAEHDLVPFTLSPTHADELAFCEAAIWWPDTTVASRSDIDLRILDSAGRPVAASLERLPVHERTSVLGAPSEAPWSVELYAAKVPRETQKVYWAAWLHPIHNIYFETDEADVLPESYPTLDTVATALEKRPELRIEIGGHTDSRGSAAYNLRLSKERARAVYDYLMKAHPDLNPEQFTVKGYGETRPVAPNTTGLNMAKNRRVEFVVLDRGEPNEETEGGAGQASAGRP